MIKVIYSQPESYSDMLGRIFTTTLITGIFCTYMLASASPTVKAFLDSEKTKSDIWQVKDIGVLYILVPLAIAFFSRVIRLHDKISDLLRIRLYFDTHHILFRMASLVGINLDRNSKRRIALSREPAMYRVFYSYAGFADPKIDKQLLRSALDNWGWFWVAIEAYFLFAVTAIMTWAFHSVRLTCICLVVLLVLSIILIIKWQACRRSADREVRAIVSDQGRKTDITVAFAEITNPDGGSVE